MSKQDNTVWVSEFRNTDDIRGALGVSFGDIYNYAEASTLFFKTKKTETESKKFMELNNALIPIMKTIFEYKKIDPSLMPDTLYGHKFGKNIKLPPVTLTSCGIVLTEQCAEILQCFRLGETQMSAMSFYDYGLQGLVDDKTYYFLNIAEWRKYLIHSECSEYIRPVRYPRDGYDELYNMTICGEDNVDYAVSEEALHADVDIWHDPQLDESIFMSGALKQALDKAKMSKPWKLVSCKLIGAR